MPDQEKLNWTVLGDGSPRAKLHFLERASKLEPEAFRQELFSSCEWKDIRSAFRYEGPMDFLKVVGMTLCIKVFFNTIFRWLPAASLQNGILRSIDDQIAEEMAEAQTCRE